MRHSAKMSGSYPSKLDGLMLLSRFALWTSTIPMRGLHFFHAINSFPIHHHRDIIYHPSRHSPFHHISKHFKLDLDHPRHPSSFSYKYLLKPEVAVNIHPEFSTLQRYSYPKFLSFCSDLDLNHFPLALEFSHNKNIPRIFIGNLDTLTVH